MFRKVATWFYKAMKSLEQIRKRAVHKQAFKHVSFLGMICLLVGLATVPAVILFLPKPSSGLSNEENGKRAIAAAGDSHQTGHQISHESGARDFPWPTDAELTRTIFPSGSNHGAALTSKGALYILRPGKQEPVLLSWREKITKLADGVRRDQVVFGDAIGNVACLNLASGKVLWRIPLSRSPVAALSRSPNGGPHLIAATRDAMIAAIDTSTGETLRGWTTAKILTHVIARPFPLEPIIITESSGCLLLPKPNGSAALPLWPKPESTTNPELSHSVIDAAIDGTGHLAILGGKNSVYIFHPDKRHGMVAAGTIITEQQPVGLALMPDGRLIVGLENGAVVWIDGMKASEYIAPPRRNETLRKMLVLSDGSVARLFASNRIDLVNARSNDILFETPVLQDQIETLNPGPGPLEFSALGAKTFVFSAHIRADW